MMDLREVILEILEEEFGLKYPYSTLERTASRIVQHIEFLLGM